MSTFKEITDRVARMASPNPSAELLIYVEQLILTYRALLIRRDHEKSRIFHEELIQVIPEIPLEQVLGEDELITETHLPRGYDVFKTTLKIPQIIRMKNELAVRFAGNTKRSVRYNYVYPDAINLVKYSRYTKKKNFFTIISDELFVINPDNTEKLRMEAIFQNPADLFDFTHGGKRLYDLDSEFPITRDLEQQIVQSIASGELTAFNPERKVETNTDQK